MKSTRVSILLLIALFVAGTLSGCSMFGSGSSDGADGTGSLSESDLDAQREARFGEGGIPSAEEEGAFRDIHFDYDSALVNDANRQDVEYNYEVIKANPEIRVVLEGHADERGTSEYNLALGNKRARAVKDILISLGVPARKIDTISYGEEVPLDPGHDEIAWAKNRRVHLSPMRDTSNR